MVADLDIYLFDLRGYLVIENALDTEHLRDALLFVDAISHGSVERTNQGERRNVVYRYGPSWGFFRHGYRPSKELLERLTKEGRRIVWPHERIAGAPGA